MSRYSGAQGAGSRKGSGRNKGIARATRAAKHAEAEERNARTPVERTRAFRRQMALENKDLALA